MAVIKLAGNIIGCCIGTGSFEGVGTAFLGAIQSAKSLAQGISTLKSKIDNARIAANVDTSYTKAQNAEKREETKKSALTTGYNKLETLISDVYTVDTKSAHKIRERKNDFYARYDYLKPDCEKTDKELRAERRAKRWQRFKDFCSGVANAVCDIVKNVVDWCKEHWELLTAALVAVAVVALAIVTFGAAAVALAAIIGATVGFLSQVMGDVIATGMNFMKTGKWEWQGSSWQEYLGATLGGALGGILIMTGHPMFANMFASGFSTFFSGHLSNATGGEKRSSLEILGNTVFSVGMSALFTKVGDKVGKSLSRSFPQITFLRRLSGRGSYDASFRGMLTKIANGNQAISGLTYRTFRNGIVSGLFGSSFETVFNSTLDFDFSDFIKNTFVRLKPQII